MKFTFSLFVFFQLFLSLSSAQLFEDFESGSLSSYALEPVVVELESGPWVFHQSLLGTDDRDRKVGEQAPRLRASGGVSGSITMGFDKPNGAGLVRFLYANSNFFGDEGGLLQLQYSSDQGENWIDAGEELEAIDSFQLAEISVNVAGDIRFRIAHRGGNRMNIDEFEVTDFAEEPTISVLRGNTQLANNATLDLGIASLGFAKVQPLTIRNLGNEPLEIQDILISGDNYDVQYETSQSQVEPGSSIVIEVVFISQQTGFSEGELTINSNADNHPVFTLSLIAEGFERDVIPISEARSQTPGSRVSVSGWITAYDELRGPVFFDDLTGGLGWFNDELMPQEGSFGFNASIGDSIVVSGTLVEENPIPGQPGTGMLKISGDDFEYEVFPQSNRLIEPIPISINQLVNSDFSGRLVRVNSASFSQSGTFVNETTYTISDRTSDNGRYGVKTGTGVAGNGIPSQRSGLIGIVFRNSGTNELISRGIFDIDENAYVYPGDDIPQNQTLDVVTWNIEWFGSTSSGPSNIQLQVDNVKTVIENLNADVYAFQEISSNQVFNQLVSELEGYSGRIANYSQTQKTAYVYKTDVIEILNFGLLTTGQNSNDWAGRLPFWIFFSAMIDEEEIEVHTYNIHAKAFSDQTSYNQRVNSSTSLKSFLDTNRPNQNVLFLGDYNDFVTSSTIGGDNPSPYQNFMQDPAYAVLTSTLETAGFASFRFTSMIDHITVTNDLIEAHIDGAQRVDDTSTYISNYLNTTSDHFPVLTRFYFGSSTSVEDEDDDIPQKVSLSQNYPNPFNPSTTIQFELSNNEQVTLIVYDVTGRKVATLLNGEHRSSGVHTVSFNAGNLASGMYLYRLSLSNGVSITNKMMLVK